MSATDDGRGGGVPIRDARRILAAHGGSPAAPGGESLERQARPSSVPRLDGAPLLEGHQIEARDLMGAPVAAFGAFLDGIQRSVVIGYLDITIPVVHGTTAAAIRERDDRTLHTWSDGPIVERSLFLPAALAGTSTMSALAASGIPVHNTLPAADPVALRHPAELLGLARQAVQARREQAEERLAGAWCASARTPLYVDGGIGGFAAASRSPLAVGVVKSHHTLYVDADAVATVASLRPGQRTSAFVVATRRRTRVASWYLRLRDTGAPLGGLVRVEVAEAGFDSARADQISGWVLAEREPVALPDSRWDVMAYGIRDCEEYLRAVAG